MGKEQEIAQLIGEGALPAEVVRQGYSRGTVYKVAHRLNGEGSNHSQDVETSHLQQTDGLEAEVESDPEVFELRKSLRKTQLEKQIEEIKGPNELESRLMAIEQKVEGLIQLYEELQEEVSTMLLSGIREKFTCTCGSAGLVAVNIKCTSCSQTVDYGWYPEPQQ